MSNRRIFIIVVLVAILGMVVFQFRHVFVSGADIRERFACDRVTLEYRETDYYCSHPVSYRLGLPVSKEYRAPAPK